MQKGNFFLAIFTLLFFVSACQFEKTIHPSLKNILQNKQFTILLSYSSDCPLCQRYTHQIRAINDSLPANFQLYFVKIDADEKWDFDWSTSLDNQVILDSERQICQDLNIKVYPQVVILSKSGKVHYSGAIDNRSDEIGTISAIITKEYLKHAIVDLSANNQKMIPFSTAVGCFIE
jgi:thioredoxin-related protein